MKQLMILGLGVALGLAAAWLMLSDEGRSSDPGMDVDARKPLYWVAPMDASYRRPGPGKSPMGMDLVPVYGNRGSDEGLVQISPAVVSNLGVRVGVVKERTLVDTIRSVGYVRYDEERLSHVHPRVAGWIEELHVKSAGALVEAGAPLYTLYAPQLVSAQEELRIAVQRGAEDLISASAERLESLQIPVAIIEGLRSGGPVQRTVTFRAMQAGVVDNLNIREGFFVEPGTTLMSIGSLETVWVEVEAFERDAHRIAAGLPVRMTLPYLPDRQWSGVIDYIYPTVDARLRTLTLRLRFANGDRTLKPNMFAEVAIETPPVTALVTPREAVIRIGDVARVVREEAPGAYRSVNVSLGQVIGDYQEVLRGLSSGDRVVTSAQFLLDSESSKSAGLSRMDNEAGADEALSIPTAEDDDSGHDMSGHDMSRNRGDDMSGHGDPDMGASETGQGGHQHD